ncbi:MAG: GNAT family N-acetyltransferase [Blastocatellia bacterium]
MKIIDFPRDDANAIGQAAELLVTAFAAHWPEAWPTIEDACEEVRQSLAEERICRAALGEDGGIVGWIGGIPIYEGNVWELHPLVVDPKAQGRGIGRRLVEDLEAQAARRGGMTLWLGSDDEDGMTSIANVDLYPDPLARLARIRNLRGHPYEFYQKLGFVIVGVMPDANGPGKPDIYLAKRIKKGG